MTVKDRKIKDIEVARSIKQTMDALDNINNNLLKMHRNKITVDIPAIKNYWMDMPKEMGSKGVILSLMSDPHDKDRIVMCYVPKNGEVKPHFHKAITELITVVSGKLHYKLYASDEFKTVIAQGQLTTGGTLEIEPLKSHYVFTTDEEVYMKIKFTPMK